jgi:hypothetical protein
VQQPSDEPKPTPTPKPRARPRRAPKFVLPERHHDERAGERTDEHIEAFLDGPVAITRRPPADRPIREPRPFELDTRPDWAAAVRREAARHARYGRPASILVIEVADCPTDVAVDRVAHGLADIIRSGARETDRAVRIATLSFRLLLPETGGRAARTAAERIEGAFRARWGGTASAPDLHIEIATAPRIGSLEEALAEAERRLETKAGTVQAPATG